MSARLTRILFRGVDEGGDLGEIFDAGNSILDAAGDIHDGRSCAMHRSGHIVRHKTAGKPEGALRMTLPEGSGKLPGKNLAVSATLVGVVGVEQNVVDSERRNSTKAVRVTDLEGLDQRQTALDQQMAEVRGFVTMQLEGMQQAALGHFDELAGIGIDEHADGFGG